MIMSVTLGAGSPERVPRHKKLVRIEHMPIDTRETHPVEHSMR